jgi:hypothetical protein
MWQGMVAHALGSPHDPWLISRSPTMNVALPQRKPDLTGTYFPVYRAFLQAIDTSRGKLNKKGICVRECVRKHCFLGFCSCSPSL